MPTEPMYQLCGVDQLSVLIEGWDSPVRLCKTYGATLIHAVLRVHQLDRISCPSQRPEDWEIVSYDELEGTLSVRLRK